MRQLNDLTGPAPVQRKLLEKDIQAKCVDWARARGYWARKFSSMSQRSVPDYLFAKGDVKFACEFKRPGLGLTEAQREEANIMVHAGWFVFMADNFEWFTDTVLRLEKRYAQSL